MKRWTYVIGGLLALTPTAAFAQDGGEPLGESPAASEEAAKAPSSPPISLSIKANSIYAFRTDLKDADASVSRFLVGGGVDLGWKASEKLSLSFGVDYEFADYDFNDGSNIIAGLGDDPFDNFNTVGFGISGTYRFNTQWFWTLGGFANGGWEAGADVSDAWSGGGYTTVGLNVSDRLAVGIGVGASTQLESEPIVFPAIFVRWQINDQFRLASDRLGLRFSYTPIESVDVYLRANWERREYRLDDTHAKIDNGILRDTTVPVGIGVDWRPVGGLTVGFEAGALVYSKLKFRNDLGNTVTDSELDTGPYLRVMVEYKF